MSHLLATQKYEELNGLVEEKTIETLKQSVDLLTEEQRNLIIVAKDHIRIIGPIDINVKMSETNDNEYAIEVSKIVYYTDVANTLEDDSQEDQNIFEVITKNIDPKPVIICNYTFERKYVNGIGTDWIITLANHFTLKPAD